MRLAHANRTKTSEKSAHQQQQHDKKKRKRNYERRRYLWTVVPSNHRKSSLNRGGNLKTLKQRKQEAKEKNNKAPKKGGGKGRFLVFQIFFFFKFPAQKLVEESKVAGRPPERLFNPLPSPPPLPPPPQPPPPSRKQNSALYRLSKREKKEATRALLFFRCLDNFLLKKDVKFLERIIIPVYITFLRALMCVFSSRVNYVCISIQITLNGNKEDRS